MQQCVGAPEIGSQRDNSHCFKLIPVHRNWLLVFLRFFRSLSVVSTKTFCCPVLRTQQKKVSDLTARFDQLLTPRFQYHSPQTPHGMVCIDCLLFLDCRFALGALLCIYGQRTLKHFTPYMSLDHHKTRRRLTTTPKIQAACMRTTWWMTGWKFNSKLLLNAGRQSDVSSPGRGKTAPSSD